MSGSKKLLFSAILLTYLVAAILFATFTPPWQTPDEPAHYNYIRYLAANTSFPELTVDCYNQDYLNQLTSRRFPAELSIDNVCYEFHQPPLYYLLATPVFWLGNGQLLVLRLVSAGLGLGVVVLAFFVARTIFPNRAIVAFGTMALVAFVPMHVAILSSVNNDALAELILASLLFLMVRRIMSEKEVSVRDNVLLGVVLGLGLVTKTTVYIAVPLIATMFWLTKITWPKLLRQAITIYGLALLIALPWYIRNMILYGNLDVLGLGRHDEVVVGQLRTADFLAQVGGTAYAGNFITTTFRSFWGQFGWMAVPMDGRTYLLLTLLTIVAVFGFVAFWFTESSPTQLSVPQRRSLIILGVTVLLMFVAYGGYNLAFVQFQGRYLFPSMIPLALFFSLGLIHALQRKWAWGVVIGLVGALGWVFMASNANSGLDKWAALIIGLALALIIIQQFLPARWSEAVPWLLLACYLGLIILTLASPFWFIIPNL